MKKIVYLSLLCVFLPTVCAFDYYYTINMTTLPFARTEHVVLLGDIGEIMNFSYGNYTTGPSYLNFTNIDMVLDVNVNVPNGVLPGEYHSIVQGIGSSHSYNVSFVFNIINNTNISTNYTDYIQLDINEFEYVLCDYNQPYHTNKYLSVMGLPHTRVVTVFNSSVFTLPLEFNLSETGYYSLNIGIDVKNVTAGYYTHYVKLQVGVNVSDIIFHFNVQDCVQPFPDFNEMVRICSIVNKTPEEYIECQRLQMEYQMHVYQAMLEANEPKEINHTVIEYVNFTNRVPVLDLNNPELISALQQLPTIWNQIQSKESLLRSKDEEITRLNNEKLLLDSQINDKVKLSVETLFNELQNKDKNITYYKENYIKKTTLWGWIGVIVIIGGLVALYYFDLTCNWW